MEGGEKLGELDRGKTMIRIYKEIEKKHFQLKGKKWHLLICHVSKRMISRKKMNSKLTLQFPRRYLKQRYSETLEIY